MTKATPKSKGSGWKIVSQHGTIGQASRAMDQYHKLAGPKDSYKLRRHPVVDGYQILYKEKRTTTKRRSVRK